MHFLSGFVLFAILNGIFNKFFVVGRDLLRRSRVLVVCGHSVTEAMKNDIAVAQRLGITATTLEGILTVKGQGRC